MCWHWSCCNVWELVFDSIPLFLGKRSSEGVFISDVGVDVLLGTKFSSLTMGDEATVEFCPKDVLWGSKVIDIDIGHWLRRGMCG